MKTLNIMTSCDDNLAPYIMPQIAAMGKNLREYKINFFICHYRADPANIKALKDYAENYDNITITEIIVGDIARYEEMARYGGHWPPEAYFSICCWDYLPDYVDRVWYIDAGDVLIVGDAEEYYYGDFEGKSILATCCQFKGDSVFDQSDLENLFYFPSNGTFNSGSFVINIESLRKAEVSADDIVEFAASLHFQLNNSISLVDILCSYHSFVQDKINDDSFSYLGDQALLSYLFAGDVKYFAYPENTDADYMPYNFTMNFFLSGDKPNYSPKVVHFAGIECTKPWLGRFCGDDFIAGGGKIEMKPEKLKLYSLWWEYCKETPLYDKLIELR